MSRSESTGEQPGPGVFNAPNALCLLRLIGSPAMPWLAAYDRPWMVVAVLIGLLLTDWIDGKVARLLRQRTRLGPKLDSVADAAMYLSAAIALGLLRPEFLPLPASSGGLDHLPWLIVIAASYALNLSVSLFRFARMPSYHTRAAKTGWLLVGVVIAALMLDGPVWLLHLAAVFVTATNLEATAISLVLRQPRSDVPSIYHAWKYRDG